MEFDWNETKAQTNLNKHGVSFEEFPAFGKTRMGSTFTTRRTPKVKIDSGESDYQHQVICSPSFTANEIRTWLELFPLEGH